MMYYLFVILLYAFKYLKDGCKSFDVGVAYLGPVVNARLVDVGRGFTRYGRLKFPHKLFVYKN